MPTTRKRGAAVAAATLGLLLSGALSGCSISKDDDPEKRDDLLGCRTDADGDRGTQRDAVGDAVRRPRRRPRHPAPPSPGPRRRPCSARPSSRSSTRPPPGPRARPTVPGPDVVRAVPAVRHALDRRHERRRALLHDRRLGPATPPASRSRSSRTRRTRCGPARCSRPGTTSARKTLRETSSVKYAQRQGAADHRRRRCPTARAGTTSSATPAAAPGTSTPSGSSTTATG